MALGFTKCIQHCVGAEGASVAYKVGFGKYGEKTLEWLFFNDPGYVWWMIKEGVHRKRFTGPKLARFVELAKKAKRLKIPGVCPWCRKRPVDRMLLVRHTSGGLARADFDCDVCAKEVPDAIQMPPGFFTPDAFRSYDKTGGKFMVQAIKRAYFGSSSHRMTQKRLEEFFDTEGNFHSQ